MQCDYCGQEVLGRAIEVDLQPEDMSPDTDLSGGDLHFCSSECHYAYLEEAGISPDSHALEEEGEEEEALFSDGIRYSI